MLLVYPCHPEDPTKLSICILTRFDEELKTTIVLFISAKSESEVLSVVTDKVPILGEPWIPIAEHETIEEAIIFHGGLVLSLENPLTQLKSYNRWIEFGLSQDFDFVALMPDLCDCNKESKYIPFPLSIFGKTVFFGNTTI